MWGEVGQLQDFLHFLINILLDLVANESNIGKTNGILLNNAKDKLKKMTRIIFLEIFFLVSVYMCVYSQTLELFIFINIFSDLIQIRYWNFYHIYTILGIKTLYKKRFFHGNIFQCEHISVANMENIK